MVIARRVWPHRGDGLTIDNHPMIELSCVNRYIKMFMNINYVRTGLLVLVGSLAGILALGCCGSGVSYSDKNKCLIVVKNDAILSWKNIVIGCERQIDTILLKKDRDGQVRVTYFDVFTDSRLSISSEEDFQFDFVNGRISLCSTNKISVLTNQYDRCASNGLNIFSDNCKQIAIDEVNEGRITYVGHRGATHIIWIDAKLSNNQQVHIPLGINGVANTESVLLTVERRERCDVVIQENLYEFGVF